jgi:hypothetical protein
MLKLARLDALRTRLSDALADRPALARVFEDALTRHDEAALGVAFEALHAGPAEARERVEAVILDWLFGGDGEIALAQLAPSEDSSTVH